MSSDKLKEFLNQGVLIKRLYAGDVTGSCGDPDCCGSLYYSVIGVCEYKSTTFTISGSDLEDFVKCMLDEIKRIDKASSKS